MIPAEKVIKIQRAIRRYRRANTPPKKRGFLLFGRYFAQMYCNVAYWVERLLEFVGSEQSAADG